MLGTSITGCIVKNIDKIQVKFIDEYRSDMFKSWSFKLYFNKRSIFGFRKYIKITLKCRNYRKYKDFNFDIEIEFSTGNIFGCNNYVQISADTCDNNSKKLSEILYNVWYRDTYKEESSRWEKLGKVLNKNLI